jgi:dTDP-glucose 4,6-dehydratase/UDP-glucose 4-epimerase
VKVLIIGSEGFIGHALVKHFSRKNVQVFGVDIVSQTLPNYFYINAASPDYNEVFQNTSFDLCINASGAANVNLSEVKPAWDYELNTHNVFKMLEGIRKFAPACKFIHLSSAAVYGNPESLPISESFPIKPLSPYGFHKWQSEILCQEFASVYGVQSVVLRIFSAFGPGLAKQLFWDLYQKSTASKNVEIFGTGIETRDFIFIDDIIRAIEIISKASISQMVINVANGEEISIKTAAKTFFTHLDTGIDFSFNGEVRKGDPKNWQADISILKSLGYKQQVTFKQGIDQYCKWLKTEGNLK